MKIDYSLYLITNRFILKNISLKKAIEEAILGGASIIQVREKDVSTKKFFNIAKEIQEVTKYYNIPIIINDRIDIAQAIDADGVHLGQDDMEINYARKILGKDKIIGLSCGTVEEAINAEKNGANYIGIGSIFSTKTKADADTPIGTNKLKEITSKIHIPSVGIGGITLENAKSVIDNGATGVSVISCILGSNDITNTTQKLKKIILS